MLDSTWRLYARHSALSLDGGGQRASLAAYECAGAAVDVQFEIKSAVEDILTQQPYLLSLRYSGL